MSSLNNAPPSPVVEREYYDRFGMDEGALYARFDRWSRRLEGHWSEWLSEARECFDIVAGRQWTDEEESEMQELNRVPVVFNRVQPTIDAVSGAEIQGRQQIQYFPREVGDTAVSEILTQGAEYEMEQCNGDEEDSDAFRDCLICGVGVTETRPEVMDGEASIISERIDPLEVLFDPGNRKACFSDARYLRREKHMDEEEFREMFPGVEPMGDQSTGKRRTIVDPNVRYTHGMLGDDDKGDVVVTEWQWFETEEVYAVSRNGEVVTLSDEELEMALQINPQLPVTRQQRRVFYRAFASGPQIMAVEEIEAGDFTYKAITGKRDRNKGVFYGLVRPMRDPQKFANKFFSQILNIINSNAKGGVAVEMGAVADIRNFEESWARADAVTEVADGALQNGRIMPKQPPAYPQGSDRLMQISVESVRDVTGVNMELLGLADRDQPGILEQQRKQAAYGILAAFFDARRRYMKMKGKLVLKLIQKYIPADKLVRIVGQDGTPQYVPMALAQGTAKYDIVVDEAPAAPNQKLQTFQILTQIMPMLTNANLPDDFWAELVKYSPLPAGLSMKLSQSIMQAAQAEQQAAAPQQELAQRIAVADVANKEAEAMGNQATAVLKQAEAQEAQGQAYAKPARDAAEIDLDRARAAEINNRIVNDLDQRTNTGEN